MSIEFRCQNCEGHNYLCDCLEASSIAEKKEIEALESEVDKWKLKTLEATKKILERDNRIKDLEQQKENK